MEEPRGKDHRKQTWFCAT